MALWASYRRCFRACLDSCDHVKIPRAFDDGDSSVRTLVGLGGAWRRGKTRPVAQPANYWKGFEVAEKLFFKIGADDSGEKIQRLFDAVNSESPMPAALVCAAFIDECLADVLREYFIEGKTSESLLKSDRMIGSLFARAQVAYCLGLIGKQMFQNITTIGEIRNVFAHNPALLDFDSPDIAKLCGQLVEKEPAQQIGDPIPEFVRIAHAQPRERFISTAIQTVLFLVMRRKADRCKARG